MDESESKLRATLSHPRACALVTALAAVAALPSLALGFVTDDYGFRAALHSHSPYAPAVYDLFAFVRGGAADNEAAVAAGHLPWWSAPDLRIHFVRPLTSLLFAADDAVFGDHALAYHLHSLAWYVALVAALGVFYRRLFPTGPAAALALLVFALSHAHVYPYAWPSARHVLVGGLPVVVALWAHVKYCEDAWRPGSWIAPLALALGLAGSEAALAGVAFWVAYDLAGVRPDGGDSRMTARMAACLPALVVGGAYLALYRFVGGGARGSGGYHDPAADPIGFASVAVTRVPVLLGDALFGVPSELAMVAPERAVAVVGLVAAGLVGVAFVACRPLMTERERATLRWLVPGAVVSTVLGASGFPGGRVLVLPDVGFAALLGVLLSRGFEAGARQTLRVVLVGLLTVVHLVLAPLSSWRAVAKIAHRARSSEAVARRIAREARPDGRVFLVASDPMVFLYPRGILAATQPGALRCESVLSAARSGHRITRTGDSSLALEPIDRPLLDGSFDTLFRAEDRPLAEGDTFRQCGAAIRVAAVASGHPTRLEITFDRSLDRPDLDVLVWRSSHLERLDALAVGATVEVPWSPGPSGAL